MELYINQYLENEKYAEDNEKTIREEIDNLLLKFQNDEDTPSRYKKNKINYNFKNLDNYNEIIKNYVKKYIIELPSYQKYKSKDKEIKENIQNLNISKEEKATELYLYYMKYEFDYEHNFGKDIKKYFDYIKETISNAEKRKEICNICKQYHLFLWNICLDYKIVDFNEEIIVFKNDKYCLTLESTSGRLRESYMPRYFCYFNDGTKTTITNGCNNQQNMIRDDFIKDLIEFIGKFF